MSNEEKQKELMDIIKPLNNRSKTSTRWMFHHVKRNIQELIDEYDLKLMPDFQRGHVWEENQKISFIESVLKTSVQTTVIKFNFPEKDSNGNPLGNEVDVTCIDGLQRLNAIISFIDGDFKVFNNQVSYKDLYDSKYIQTNVAAPILIEEYSINNTKDLLNYYYDINFKGVKHSSYEQSKILEMIDKINYIEE